MTKSLTDFNELYNYLITLSSVLKAKGGEDLAHEAERASRLAVGLKIGLSTEFIGESRIALRRILTDGRHLLSQEEEADMEDVLRQLTASINKWPVKP